MYEGFTLSASSPEFDIAIIFHSSYSNKYYFVFLILVFSLLNLSIQKTYFIFKYVITSHVNYYSIDISRRFSQSLLGAS